MTELKLRCNNLDAVELKLTQNSATYLGESHTKHTYFNQSPGSVLKLVDNGESVSKVTLQKRVNTFDRQSKTLNNPKDEAQILTGQFGVKKVLTMHSKKYKIGDTVVGLYKIDGLGTFVILESEHPTIEEATIITGLQNPEVVTESFDNL